MRRTPHPDDVLLSLGHMTTPDGPRISLYAEAADTDRRLLTVDLHPEQFALLIGARVVITRSETPIEHPPVVAHSPVTWLNVTLHSTTNFYLQTPCEGQLQITEYGTDGSVIRALFRRRDHGVLSAPVDVPYPQFSYGAVAEHAVRASAFPHAFATVPLHRVEDVEEARMRLGVPFPYRGVWRSISVTDSEPLHVFTVDGPDEVRRRGYVPAERDADV